MSAALAGSSAMFEERIDPGRVSSFLLAGVVHLLLLAVLMFGVRWQNRPPEAVVVELWNEPPPAPVQEEPKPAPKPEPAPAPAVLKPAPAVPKPDIAEKAPPPKPKPVPKAESKPKPAPPPRVPARPRDEEAQRQIREQLNREQAALADDRERQQIRDQIANDAAAARNKAIADWVNKVRAKIRGNVVLPPDLKGNPEAIFDVVQLPTGEVLSVKLRKSSGHAGYDIAIERAVLKSSPLPRPDRPELFQRALELKFRPLD